MVICQIGEDTVLTRVVQLVSENGEVSYVVKFDTAPANDTFKIPAENVIARATSQSSAFGSVLNFATSTFGIMLVIIIPSLIIIIFQVVRIINVKRHEEEAFSLDELDEIMTADEDNSQDFFFEEPASFTTPPPAPEPEPLQERSVLSVDKNGKAGLTAVRDEDTPLFTYEGYTDKKGGTNIKKGSSVVKPVKTPHADNFFSEYASEDEKKPLYESKPAEDASAPAFMSDVIPQKIAETAANSEIPAAEQAEEVKAYEPKAVREDKIVREAKNIPEQAVIPKEKLAPPKKKNNSKAISELMSIIDAEESKLKK